MFSTTTLLYAALALGAYWLLGRKSPAPAPTPAPAPGPDAPPAPKPDDPLLTPDLLDILRLLAPLLLKKRELQAKALLQEVLPLHDEKKV